MALIDDINQFKLANPSSVEAIALLDRCVDEIRDERAESRRLTSKYIEKIRAAIVLKTEIKTKQAQITALEFEIETLTALVP